MKQKTSATYSRAEDLSQGVASKDKASVVA